MGINLSISGGSSQTLTVSEAAFGRDFNEALIHQVVTAYQAGGRAGTKAQKNRSDVSGGGAKPWRQKGTGRARAGSSRSPIWRSGGVTFAARPRDFSQKVNRKMYRGALRSIMSELIRQDRVVIVDEFVIQQPKTKELVNKLNELSISDALLVFDEVPENLYLASRNLHKIDVTDLEGINPVVLISYEKVVINVAAMKKLEEILG